MSAAIAPVSGWCASCGTRVVESDALGVYEPPAGTARYLYLLCRGCATAVRVGDRESVLLAVEQRVRFGRGVRA